MYLLFYVALHILSIVIDNLSLATLASVFLSVSVNNFCFDWFLASLWSKGENHNLR